MKKFLLVDDHKVVRCGLNRLLLELYKPCEIFESGDGDMAVKLLKLHQYDLIMMDIQMPKTDTLGLMDYIRIRYPATKVLVFSMSAEAIFARRFLKAGAKGFLSKNASMDEIKDAIGVVLNNQSYISETLTAEEEIADRPLNPFDLLSSREFEIASLLLTCNSLTEISEMLHLQTTTVGTHKGRLFKKLAVDNLIELKDLANTYNI